MSEAKEEDFSKLPLEDKLAHKAWKARVDGYRSLIEEFENSRHETDPCFELISNNPELLKLFVTDSNVIAQESGILAVAKYFQFGGTPERVEKLKLSALLRTLCEKGLSANRAGTKANTNEVILQLIEISGSGDWIVEVLSSLYDNRLPKLVASCVNCTFQTVENFGCTIVSPKLIIPCLAKLFAHADRNVRSETTKLTVELYKWLGDGLMPLLFNNLKQVQQRDLTAEFEKVKDLKPVQIRMTRAQQISATPQTDGPNSGDSDMDIVEELVAKPEFDPFEMLDPVDILSKLPSDFGLKISSAKWQDRKEALEQLNEVLKMAPKISSSDYLDLMRQLAKSLKDANIQNVQLTAHAIEHLSKGLREEFKKYQNLVFGLMIERTKENKPLVVQALQNAMLSIFEFSSLQDILDDILAGMKHRTPKIKISSMNYLLKCLGAMKTMPKISLVDQIMETGVKLLSDPQEPVRQACTELIGILMKIVGERDLKKLLTGVDENRLTKVKAVYEKADVCVSKDSSSGSKALSSTRRASLTVVEKSATPVLMPKHAPIVKAIPTKRIATSPARREDVLAKAPVKSFTGRTLIQSKTIFETPKPNAVRTVSPEVREEVELLKKENTLLQSRCEQLVGANSSREEELVSVKTENGILRAKLEQLESELSERNTASRQKDINIARLTSDLENSQAKIKTLEQKVEMARLQQNTSLTPSLLPPMVSDSSRFSPFRSPERLSKVSSTLQELSSRVDLLSIDGTLPETKEASDATQARKDFEFSSEEDSWRRAAEVTAELKARIEKMKQRNKMSIRS